MRFTPIKPFSLLRFTKLPNSELSNQPPGPPWMESQALSAPPLEDVKIILRNFTPEKIMSDVYIYLYLSISVPHTLSLKCRYHCEKWCQSQHPLPWHSWKAQLVGGWPTPLKKMTSSVGVTIPNILKNITCSKPPTSQYIVGGLPRTPKASSSSSYSASWGWDNLCFFTALLTEIIHNPICVKAT